MAHFAWFFRIEHGKEPHIHKNPLSWKNQDSRSPWGQTKPFGRDIEHPLWISWTKAQILGEFCKYSVIYPAAKELVSVFKYYPRQIQHFP